MKKLLIGLLISFVAQGSLLHSEIKQQESMEAFSKNPLLKIACEQQFSPFIHDGVEYKGAIEMQCDFLNEEFQKYKLLEKLELKKGIIASAQRGHSLSNIFNPNAVNNIVCAIDTILTQETDENKRKELALWLSHSPLKHLKQEYKTQ